MKQEQRSSTADKHFRGSDRQEPSRKLRFSNRNNAGFKWKSDKSVVGALEFKSQPHLEPRATMEEHWVTTREDEYGECLQLWKQLKLQKSMAEAVDTVPPAGVCCGLIVDRQSTIRNVAQALNEGWAKKITKQKLAPHGFKVTLFVWSWNNVSGQAETVELLVLFHSLSMSRKIVNQQAARLEAMAEQAMNGTNETPKVSRLGELSVEGAPHRVTLVVEDEERRK